jgi:hypothetical protein
MWLAVISDPRIVTSCTPDRGATAGAGPSSTSRASASSSSSSSSPCSVPGAEKFLNVYRHDHVLLERVKAVLDSVNGRKQKADTDSTRRLSAGMDAQQTTAPDVPPIKISEKWRRNLSNWSRV